MVEYRFTSYHCKRCSKFLFEDNAYVSVDRVHRYINLHKRINTLIYNRAIVCCPHCNGFIGSNIGIPLRNSNSLRSSNPLRIFARIFTLRVDKITTILHDEF